MERSRPALIEVPLVRTGREMFSTRHLGEEGFDVLWRQWDPPSLHASRVEERGDDRGRSQCVRGLAAGTEVMVTLYR